MGDEIKDYSGLKKAMAEAFKEALAEQGGCNPQRCKERCGVTQAEHYAAHQRMDVFFGALTDSGKVIRHMIVKGIVIAICALILLGASAKLAQMVDAGRALKGVIPDGF